MPPAIERTALLPESDRMVQDELEIMSGWIYRRNAHGILNSMGPKLWRKLWMVVDPRTGQLITYLPHGLAQTQFRKRAHRNRRDRFDTDDSSRRQHDNAPPVDRLAETSNQRHVAVDDISEVFQVHGLASRFEVHFVNDMHSVYHFRAQDAEDCARWVEGIKQLQIVRSRLMNSTSQQRLVRKQKVDIIKPVASSSKRKGGKNEGKKQHKRKSGARNRRGQANSDEFEDATTTDGFYFDDEEDGNEMTLEEQVRERLGAKDVNAVGALAAAAAMRVKARMGGTAGGGRSNAHAMTRPVKLMERLSGEFGRKRNSTDNPLSSFHSSEEGKGPRHGTDASSVSQGSTKSAGRQFAKKFIERAVKKGTEGLKRKNTKKKNVVDSNESEKTDSLTGMSGPRSSGRVRSRIVSMSVGGLEVNLVHGQSVSESALVRTSISSSANMNAVRPSLSSTGLRDGGMSGARRTAGLSVHDVGGERKTHHSTGTSTGHIYGTAGKRRRSIAMHEMKPRLAFAPMIEPNERVSSVRRGGGGVKRGAREVVDSENAVNDLLKNEPKNRKRNSSKRNPSQINIAIAEPEGITRKSRTTRKMLQHVIEQSRQYGHTVVFEDLDTDGISELVRRMVRVDVAQDQVVVRQGESSGDFFIIEKGSFDIYSAAVDVRQSDPRFGSPIAISRKQSSKSASRKKMKRVITKRMSKANRGMQVLGKLIATQGARSYFGELGLLYEQAGRITVISKTAGRLWKIKRSVFHDITTSASLRRQSARLQYLSSIPVIANNLSSLDVVALSDAVETETFRSGDVIVSSGQVLHKVYVVQEGVAKVITNNGGVIDRLVSGDTYGEWALLDHGAIAEHSLHSHGKVTVVLSLDIEEFEELLGPFRELLKKRWKAVSQVQNQQQPTPGAHPKISLLGAPTSNVAQVGVTREPSNSAPGPRTYALSTQLSAVSERHVSFYPDIIGRLDANDEDGFDTEDGSTTDIDDDAEDSETKTTTKTTTTEDKEKEGHELKRTASRKKKKKKKHGKSSGKSKKKKSRKRSRALDDGEVDVVMAEQFKDAQHRFSEHAKSFDTTNLYDNNNNNNNNNMVFPTPMQPPKMNSDSDDEDDDDMTDQTSDEDDDYININSNNDTPTLLAGDNKQRTSRTSSTYRASSRASRRPTSTMQRESSKMLLEDTLATLTAAEGDETEGLDRDWTPSEPLRPHTDLDDLVPVALLGRGSFGRVHLVVDSAAQKQVRSLGVKNGPEHIYALKCLIRSHVVRNGWQSMVENERAAMLELSAHVRSPFILNCYNTFVDEKNCYFLLEVCRGGDFYQLLCSRPEQMLTEDEAKFFIGSVVLGLSAMHERSILYRDLKPENIMITDTGNVKIADFGLCKKTLRTFTVCGTPDYVAPETILCRGSDVGVDWWALGVLLYEILEGETPFYAREPMDIYDNIVALEDSEQLMFCDDVPLNDDARAIICKLLEPKKTRRLGNLRTGSQGIRKHPFFDGFDWDSLAGLKMEPPLQAPRLLEVEEYIEMDLDDVDYDAQLLISPDDTSGWEPDF